ncbi:MAG: radical SAM protein [Bacteroidetes bacterium]|nr:radical SAM protein [Bacteroidota bacterium]
MDVSTFLFGEIIFGPIESRRLGKSLGINLLPVNCKLCNFNCLYCECGWTHHDLKNNKLPTRLQVNEALTDKLARMVANNHHPDYITFAGNGEPTLHPEFAEIVKDTIELRNKLIPESKIAVLSNATMLHNENVFEILKQVDGNIQKLDSAIEHTFQLINQPKGKIKVKEVIANLKRLSNVTIQILFLQGEHKGEKIDNTSDEEIDALIGALKKINPQEVMVYTISRSTPLLTLYPVSSDELSEIAGRFKKEGFMVIDTSEKMHSEQDDQNTSQKPT